MATVIRKAYIAHHIIKVWASRRKDINDNWQATYAYEITGGKWNVGTLFSDTSPALLWRHALAEVRRDHPRASMITVLDELSSMYQRGKDLLGNPIQAE